MKIAKYLAVIAVVAALGAIPAAASASPGFGASSYPATVQLSKGTVKLSAGGYNVSCTSPTLSQTLTKSVFTMSFKTSETGSCGASGTYKMNGCSFILGASTAEIGPPGCSPMTFPGGCWLKAGGSVPVTYSVSEEIFDGVKSISGVEFSGWITGEHLCGPVEITAKWDLAIAGGGSLYTGNYALEGIALSQAATPQLEAQVFPLEVVGFGLNTQVASVGGLTVTCAKANLSGTNFGSKATADFSLTGVYKGMKSAQCSSKIGEVKVEMRSCKYELSKIEHVSGVQFRDESASLGCSGTDQVELVGPLGCTFKIPPQPLSASLVSPGGSGALDDIWLELGSESVKYTTSVACQLVGFPASGEDGVMHQGIAVLGSLVK